MIVLSIISLAALSGCSDVITSTPLPTEAEADQIAPENARDSTNTAPAAQGIVYSLPKAQVQLTASRKTITTQDVTVARKAASAAAAL